MPEKKEEKTVIIYRQDPIAKKLNTRAYSVHRWDSKGRGKYRRYFPRSWIVPVEDIPEDARPLSKEQASDIASRRRAAGLKAARTARERDDAVAEDLGLLPGSRLAKDLRAGRVDEEAATAIAESIRHRHEDTDYDDLLAAGYPKEAARALKQPR